MNLSEMAIYRCPWDGRSIDVSRLVWVGRIEPQERGFDEYLAKAREVFAGREPAMSEERLREYAQMDMDFRHGGGFEFALAGEPAPQRVETPSALRLKVGQPVAQSRRQKLIELLGDRYDPAGKHPGRQWIELAHSDLLAAWARWKAVEPEVYAVIMKGMRT